MANLKNMSSIFPSYSTMQLIPADKCNIDSVVKKGYLTKRKSMKKRYFVLRKEVSDTEPARLEYYDSERKFKEGHHPKKKYVLKDCFNISRKADKNNYVIALCINKECVSLVTENETEMREWLQSLQFHKNNSIGPMETKKIDYDVVWQVEVQPRSLATTKNLTGNHYLCLTNRFLSLTRADDPSIKQEFQLSTIRKCGFLDDFFFFQLGRFSRIGCGELYMQTQDSFIAQNIHNSVTSAMNSYKRSSSLTNSNDTDARYTPEPFNEENQGIRHRDRSDSVPSSMRNHFRMKLCPSLEKIQQNQHALNARLSTFPENDDAGTPDKDFADFDDLNAHYIPMDRVKSDTETTYRTSASEDDDGYVPMGSQQQKFTTSFISSPRNEPWQGGGALPKSSPRLISSSSIPGAPPDGYLHMQSPAVPKGPEGGSQYMEMSGASKSNWNEGRKPSTPIPLSPQDGIYELLGTSENSLPLGSSETSSCTSVASEDLIPQPSRSGALSSMSPSLGTHDEDPEFGGVRGNRTSSVGSKPEKFKGKARVDIFPNIGEHSRARALSLGSRISYKSGLGRQGPVGFQPPDLPHQSSIVQDNRDSGSDKSSSTPVLDVSPISHSWSGTSGSYFRSFGQSRVKDRDDNLMEMDFSKNKSCDVIPSSGGDKQSSSSGDKKSSRERLWHTFTGHRLRCNSKSSGGGSSSKGSSGIPIGLDSKGKRSRESRSLSKGSEIPGLSDITDGRAEMDLRKNFLQNSIEHLKGYLPMHSPFLSSSLHSNDNTDGKKARSSRTISLNEQYVEMSSSLSSCGSNDGYVEMSQGGVSPDVIFPGGSFCVASSSSSSSSICGASGSRNEKSNYLAMSSEEFSSPSEECPLDYREEKNKFRKSSRDKSLRESTLGRKMSENEEHLESQKSKSSPFASLSNLIRKPLSSTYSNKNILKSPKSTPIKSNFILNTPEVPIGPISSSSFSETLGKVVSPSSSGKIKVITRDKGQNVGFVDNKLKRESAELDSTEISSQKTMKVENYANLPPTVSTTTSRFAMECDTPPVSCMIIDKSPAPFPTSPGEIVENMELDLNTKFSILSSDKVEPKNFLKFSKPPSVDLKNLTISESERSASLVERTRSHSGPVCVTKTAPSETSKAKYNLARPSSACSSPVSYSPPVSPAMGSQSSMSSLSEGGLSSASSTCTVINVGKTGALKPNNNITNTISKTGFSSSTKTPSLSGNAKDASSEIQNIPSGKVFSENLASSIPILNTDEIKSSSKPSLSKSSPNEPKISSTRPILFKTSSNESSISRTRPVLSKTASIDSKCNTRPSLLKSSPKNAFAQSAELHNYKTALKFSDISYKPHNTDAQSREKSSQDVGQSSKK